MAANSQFSAKLRFAMEKKRLRTFEELAHASGVNRATIRYAIKNGGFNRSSTRLAIALALGLGEEEEDFEWLGGLEEEGGQPSITPSSGGAEAKAFALIHLVELVKDYAKKIEAFGYERAGITEVTLALGHTKAALDALEKPKPDLGGLPRKWKGQW